MKTTEERFWEKVNFNNLLDTECWLWTGAKIPSGYGSFHVPGGHMLAHRFSYELVCGSIPDNLFVCHSCDNPSCVNPHHLWVGTHKDNMIDMSNKGRWRNGGKGPESKLTPDQIINICTDERPYKDIAKDYGISSSSVCLFKSGRLHSKITGKVYTDRLGPRRLTDVEVLEILKDCRQSKDIAKDYGICVGEVYLIKNGRVHGKLTKIVPKPTKTMLSEQQVLDIVADFRSDKILAVVYGVDAKTIYRIKRGLSRSKLTGIIKCPLI